MEKIIDFDSWIKNYTPPEVEYYAIYDPETSQVTGIYPSFSAENEIHKIKIDKELAEDIQNGIVKMNTCFVDTDSDSLEIIEKQSLRKIDDIVYRIPENKYAKIQNPDVEISFSNSTNEFTFRLNENNTTRKLKYEEYTVMNFFITEYNDPHKVIQAISFKIEDIKTNIKTVKYKGTVSRFSIFTRRLFKKYVINIV